MAQFNVLMFGSRRAGKSSILSSMIDSFKDLNSTSASNITLTATEDTAGILKTKKADLQKIFSMKIKDTMKWVIDVGATDVSYTYDFTMSAKGSSQQHILSFKDIPGEWLMTNEATLKKELRESQIIIIAIDTPHLIEEDGEHSDAFHITNNVNTLLSYIQSEEDVPRLILFVPIKCEKYYHAGRMQEVVDAIETQYENLLTALRTGKKKNLYTVAITPILSLGGVVFRDFQRDENGFVDVIEVHDSSNPSLYLRPKAAYYQLYQPAPSFAPKYCEQPVLYILSFISKTVKGFELQARQKLPLNKKNPKKEDSGLGKLFSGLLMLVIALLFPQAPVLKKLWEDISKDRTLVQTANETSIHLKTTGDGYKILQDPMGIQAIK